jgi:hypothetical protein
MSVIISQKPETKLTNSIAIPCGKLNTPGDFGIGLGKSLQLNCRSEIASYAIHDHLLSAEAIVRVLLLLEVSVNTKA